MKKEFRDYSMMMGLIDVWTPENLDIELKRYKDKYKELAVKRYSINKNCDIISRNIKGFERRKKALYNIKITEEFKLTKDHVLMLKNGIDGNNNYFDTLCELFKYDQADMSDNQKNALHDKFARLIAELPLAIEFLACEKIKQYEIKE